MEKQKASSTLVVVLLLIAVFSHIFVFPPLIRYCKADPGDVSESWDNSTTLNVTVLQLQPRVNWYDFQFYNGTAWVSRLNQQIDVNNSLQYRFIVNISSDQGWDDIEYIYIEAWHDNGSEATTYNHSGNQGGNRNLRLVYDNTSNVSGIYNMTWPTGGEVTIGSMTDIVAIDPDGSPGNTECHNLTFSFIPNYQFRYAPDPANAAAGHNDLWSWNFNITVLDFQGYYSYHNPIVGETVDEFGVYSYTEIVSAGWPTITGNPGTTAVADSNISVTTRSNGNYSFSVNVDTLQHTTNPGATMANTTVWARGGDLDSLQNFTGSWPIYFYANYTNNEYNEALPNGTSLLTDDIEYRCSIPLTQLPGDYEATIRYYMITET
ncbi:MAG: hypothetical protein JW771_07170 [Candidatus Thermoplasmatota archaeon]|nr:hypothetical protein [Candidatus Thermoplasmatota archaeon]